MMSSTELINAGKGVYHPLGVIGNSSGIPHNYNLNQNYPNPFNPETNISFEIPVSGDVSLKVYDLLGNLVYTLVNGHLEAGKYNYEFSGADISSGLYFYKLSAGGYTITKKMMLLK